jgi:hypothetical protein
MIITTTTFANAGIKIAVLPSGDIRVSEVESGFSLLLDKAEATDLRDKLSAVLDAQVVQQEKAA